MTAGELAARLKLPLRGDANRPLTGAATLEEAGPEQLAFAGSPKYFDAAARSSAGCVIALPEFAGASGQIIIESPQPRAHFAEALSLLYPAPGIHPGVHPTAVVEEGAQIDPTTRVGPFVTIGRNARIGADCIIHARVSVYERVTIGARCVIHSGAVIGADGFGFEMTGGTYRKVPQVGIVSIGDGTKLDNMVHIAHNCRIGRHVVIAAQTGLAGGVTIGDYAIVGGQVGIGDKARIESKAIIGSGAGILTSKIVRAGEPVWGTPARPLRQYLAQLALLARLSKGKK